MKTAPLLCRNVTVSTISQYHSDASVLVLWTFDGLNDRSSRPKKKSLLYFQVQQSRVEESRDFSYHRPMTVHHPLHSTCLYSRKRDKVADAASLEGETSDKVCEAAEAPAGFKPDVWKQFGLSRNETGEDRRITICGHWQTRTNTHLRNIFADILTFRVQLLFHKCRRPQAFIHISFNISINFVLWTPLYLSF